MFEVKRNNMTFSVDRKSNCRLVIRFMLPFDPLWEFTGALCFKIFNCFSVFM